VICPGLEKAIPGKPASDEDVWPEWRWGRDQFERRAAARKKEIAKVAEEDPMPGRQFYQQPRNPLVLLGLYDQCLRGHIFPY